MWVRNEFKYINRQNNLSFVSNQINNAEVSIPHLNNITIVSASVIIENAYRVCTWYCASRFIEKPNIETHSET